MQLFGSCVGVPSRGGKVTQHFKKTVVPAVKHGSAFAACGPGQLPVIDGILNSMISENPKVESLVLKNKQIK